MVLAGYMAKKVEAPLDWLGADAVVDLYSLSGCVSEYFCDYVPHWRHNGFWLFDSPQEIKEIAAANSLDMAGQQFFYYEVYEKQFDDQRRVWEPYSPDQSFKS